MKPLLSILIPSIPSRKERLNRLVNELNKQIEANFGDIEIVVDDSKGYLEGGLTVGKKREVLVRRANGIYLCFLDDDETIAPNYIEVIKSMCFEGKDICTFRAMVKLHNAWGVVNMSLLNYFNEEFTPTRIVNRPPWHMCPVKSEYAKLHDFEDINNAEDFKWMAKVLTHCKTETHTDMILFQYNHGEHSEVDKIERHGL